MASIFPTKLRHSPISGAARCSKKLDTPQQNIGHPLAGHWTPLIDQIETSEDPGHGRMVDSTAGTFTLSQGVESANEIPW